MLLKAYLPYWRSPYGYSEGTVNNGLEMVDRMRAGMGAGTVSRFHTVSSC